jgi:FtsH-binding integral membrane protein
MLDCMRSLLTTVSLLALGLWLGALVLFVQVASVAFSALPPLFLNPADGIHGAGLVVGGTLRHVHYMGLICGLVFLVCSALLRGHVRWHSVVPQAVLVLVMVVLTAYSQFSIIPRMDTAQESAGGSVASLPESSPARATFDQLHRQSTHVEVVVLILGFVAFFVAGRRHSIIV